MSVTIAKRQGDVLFAIWAAMQDGQLTPTVRELGDALGIASTNGVNDHLRALIKKGFLVRQPMKARSLQLTPLGAYAAKRIAASVRVAP